VNLQEIVIVTFIIELIEVLLQYSATLKESIYKIYKLYKKSPFLFFVSNIGYIWLLFISINYGVFNFAIVLAVALKSLDIFTKLQLIQNIYLKPDQNYINDILPLIEDRAPSWMWIIGPLTYPYIVYIALS